jgi:hypothetical protein
MSTLEFLPSIKDNEAITCPRCNTRTSTPNSPLVSTKNTFELLKGVRWTISTYFLIYPLQYILQPSALFYAQQSCLSCFLPRLGGTASFSDGGRRQDCSLWYSRRHCSSSGLSCFFGGSSNLAGLIRMTRTSWMIDSSAWICGTGWQRNSVPGSPHPSTSEHRYRARNRRALFWRQTALGRPSTVVSARSAQLETPSICYNLKKDPATFAAIFGEHTSE